MQRDEKKYDVDIDNKVSQIKINIMKLPESARKQYSVKLEEYLKSDDAIEVDRHLNELSENLNHELTARAELKHVVGEYCKSMTKIFGKIEGYIQLKTDVTTFLEFSSPPSITHIEAITKKINKANQKCIEYERKKTTNSSDLTIINTSFITTKTALARSITALPLLAAQRAIHEKHLQTNARDLVNHVNKVIKSEGSKENFITQLNQDLDKADEAYDSANVRVVENAHLLYEHIIEKCNAYLYTMNAIQLIKEIAALDQTTPNQEKIQALINKHDALKNSSLETLKEYNTEMETTIEDLLKQNNLRILTQNLQKDLENLSSLLEEKRGGKYQKRIHLEKTQLKDFLIKNPTSQQITERINNIERDRAILKIRIEGITTLKKAVTDLKKIFGEKSKDAIQLQKELNDFLKKSQDTNSLIWGEIKDQIEELETTIKVINNARSNVSEVIRLYKEIDKIDNTASHQEQIRTLEDQLPTLHDQPIQTLKEKNDTMLNTIIELKNHRDLILETLKLIDDYKELSFLLEEKKGDKYLKRIQELQNQSKTFLRNHPSPQEIAGRLDEVKANRNNIHTRIVDVQKLKQAVTELTKLYGEKSEAAKQLEEKVNSFLKDSQVFPTSDEIKNFTNELQETSKSIQTTKELFIANNKSTMFGNTPTAVSNHASKSTPKLSK